MNRTAFHIISLPPPNIYFRFCFKGNLFCKKGNIICLSVKCMRRFSFFVNQIFKHIFKIRILEAYESICSELQHYLHIVLVNRVVSARTLWLSRHHGRLSNQIILNQIKSIYNIPSRWSTFHVQNSIIQNKSRKKTENKVVSTVQR